jgi:branched-chain amino acid transport system ATP-binding protein
METDRKELLVIKNLSVGYNSLMALRDVSMDVRQGELVAVFGANGAGKSSLGRAIVRLVEPTEGAVFFNGEDLSRRKSFELRHLGLVYLPEGRGIFPTLSVSDNLKMSVRWLKDKSERGSSVERVESLFPILGKRSNQLAGSLSGGEQQMLSLARALAVWPKLVIADEVSLGLAPLVVDEVFEQLEHARQFGVSVLLIEQFVHRALGLADRVVVLDRGRVAWAGTSDGIEADAILARYVGSDG